LNDSNEGIACADCGVWIENKNFYGYGMDHHVAIGEIAASRQECRELCRGKPGCYAVTYDTGERCFHRSCIAMKNALFSCIPVPIASGILFLSSCANGFIAACAGCSRCYLKKIPKGLVPVDVEMSVSVRLCANETTPEGKRYDCGQWLLDYSFRGTKSLF
jgi:hypothetical protein